MASSTEGVVSVSNMGDAGRDGAKESQVIFRRHHEAVGHALLNISGIGTATGEPVGKDEDRPAYVFQEFPKMKYHADGRELIVNNKKEEGASAQNGFRADPYPKPKLAVADPRFEKAEQAKTNQELQAQLREMADQIEKLKKVAQPAE